MTTNQEINALKDRIRELELMCKTQKHTIHQYQLSSDRFATFVSKIKQGVLDLESESMHNDITPKE